ncbi:prolyl oligopeptidase family serine peptidase [Sphingobacterium sp. UT-1RO-CII-1]|uniref:prolyl oligopeptidase family serine peptidase n=1 Tax=Sphingobacterium sp. UT-1RO-CII-1 TaxID=2995225 RepID=UPI00227AB8F0|nr:prolyl oligopeptidase family serine peptidase [Sphingobacterium sp. UT-1RO-CII-1]MCY4778332.1 prolyl oligopeptidase family serine peptidase [Sphingobacterium sp. UT-1RO-CII-1]
MNKKLGVILLAISVVACSQEDKIETKKDMVLKPYPETEKIDQKDDYFGETVSDPYRWLEDDLSEKTKNWVVAQNEVTQDYLQQIPFREEIRTRLESLWNYEKETAPFQEGDYTYYYKNDGLQNQYVLYRKKGAEGAEEVFLDPNKFSDDGTTSLAGLSFSKDGSLVAYQISEGGSDWRKVIIMKAADKTVIGDTLIDVKFSGLAWKGNEGIFYSSYDKPTAGSALSAMTDQHKLYFHELNTAQSTDKLIFGGSATPRRYVGASLTDDERFLVVTAANATSGNELYIKDLSTPDAGFVTVVGNMDKNHYVVDSDGTKLFIYTELDAPNGRVVTTDFSNPKAENWVNLIAETEQVLSPSTAGGKIFANYLKDATSLVKQYDRTGKLEREVELPGVGTIAGFSGKSSATDLYYTFTNYVNPGTIYKYAINTGESEVYKNSAMDFDPTKYESKQVFYTSKDGTKIPMIITYKKGIVLDGTNPTMLYGYGGFNISLTPSFSTSNIILLEQGGVYAVANLRGGGEYGENWHLAGTKMSKQNVFDDFIAAAEYLISEKYTSSERLAIAGGSNGGLLVGACMTQKPDLFKVAFPAVGVLDMLRYHKFTAGAGWAYDYGTADDSQEMFAYLYKYSPYHALKEGTNYPATMVTTADHDDRVVPAHSFKFAARLQEMHKGDNPVLIRIDTNAGHGAGKSTSMVIAEQTDKWAFMLQNMGVAYKVIK